jgi:hypothetical protein
MGGIELTDEKLLVGRDPNELDELAIAFSSLLDEHGIRHVYVAGYVTILAGRARATQDIDVLIEPTDSEILEELATDLSERGFWGPAMPLDEMETMLTEGDNIWVAHDGEMAPHLEVKFASDKFDHASLQNAISAEIGESTIPIGPLELQIAYKLYLGTQTDFEDALHFLILFEESLRMPRLEDWVEELGVEADYERLRDAI